MDATSNISTYLQSTIVGGTSVFTEVAAKVSSDQLVIFCREADHNGHSKKGIALLSGWTFTPHTYPG